MKSAGFGYDVVIPAGGTIDTGYARAIGSPFRALAPLGPERRPVLQYVVDALRETGFARRILVVAPPAVQAAITGVDAWLPAEDSGAQNILVGLAAVDPNRLALVCPSDLPLLTAGSVTKFLELCRPDAEIAVGLVRAEAYHMLFPGAPPSQFTALVGTGPVTLGSIFLLHPSLITRQAILLDRLFEGRKSQWQTAKLLGPRLLWGWATKSLSVPMITTRAEELTGGKVQIVSEVSPLLAYDIDTLDDYTYASLYLK